MIRESCKECDDYGTCGGCHTGTICSTDIPVICKIENKEAGQ